MDTLKREMGQLEIENRRLREGNPDQEKLLELEAELEQSKEEIAHLTERLGELPRLEQQLSEALAQGEQLRQELQATYREADEREGEKQLRENLAQAESNAEESRRRLEEIEAQATRLAAELEHREEELLRAHKDTELQIYRAVDTERQKWEKREERLIEQISLLQTQLRSSETEKYRDERGGVSQVTIATEGRLLPQERRVLGNRHGGRELRLKTCRANTTTQKEKLRKVTKK